MGTKTVGGQKGPAAKTSRRLTPVPVSAGRAWRRILLPHVAPEGAGRLRFCQTSDLLGFLEKQEIVLPLALRVRESGQLTLEAQIVPRCILADDFCGQGV